MTTITAQELGPQHLGRLVTITLPEHGLIRDQLRGLHAEPGYLPAIEQTEWALSATRLTTTPAPSVEAPRDYDNVRIAVELATVKRRATQVSDHPASMFLGWFELAPDAVVEVH